MTKRKKRELEEQRRLEAERATDNTAAEQPVMYPGIAFGPVGGYLLPVTSGKVSAIQLPPIIQPVAMVPFLSAQQQQTEPQNRVSIDDDFDDFDDFD